MVKKNWWRIGKSLILLLAAVGLILPTVPAIAQSIEFDGATISIRMPAGYEVEETETRTTATGIPIEELKFKGPLVRSDITFKGSHESFHTWRDPPWFGAETQVHPRQHPNIAEEAASNMLPHVPGDVYAEGTMPVPGDGGVTYQGYYYLSRRLGVGETAVGQGFMPEEHFFNATVALTNTPPYYTISFWGGDWGVQDGTVKDGSTHVHTLDGEPLLVRQKAVVEQMLFSAAISGWTPPPATTEEAAFKLGGTVNVDLGTTFPKTPEFEGNCLSFELPAGYALRGDIRGGALAEGAVPTYEEWSGSSWVKVEIGRHSFSVRIGTLGSMVSLHDLAVSSVPEGSIHEQDHIEIDGHEAYYVFSREVSGTYESNKAIVVVSVGENRVLFSLSAIDSLDTETKRHSVDGVQVAEKSKQSLQQVFSSLAIGSCGALSTPETGKEGTAEQVRSRLEQTYEMPFIDGDYAKWTKDELLMVEAVFDLVGADFLKKCQIPYLTRDKVYVDRNGNKDLGVFGATDRLTSAVSIFDRARVPDDFDTADAQFKGTLIHELIHPFQLQDPVTEKRYTWDTVKSNPLMKDWMKLSEWQEVPIKASVTGRPWSFNPLKANFVTEYSKWDPYEDMAETAMFYVLRPEWLLKHCPLKYQFFRERIFKGKTFD